MPKELDFSANPDREPKYPAVPTDRVVTEVELTHKAAEAIENLERELDALADKVGQLGETEDIKQAGIDLANDIFHIKTYYLRQLYTYLPQLLEHGEINEVNHDQVDQSHSSDQL